jgi:DNA mismatch repair ATPase MutL
VRPRHVQGERQLSSSLPASPRKKRKVLPKDGSGRLQAEDKIIYVNPVKHRYYTYIGVTNTSDERKRVKKTTSFGWTQRLVIRLLRTVVLVTPTPEVQQPAPSMRMESLEDQAQIESEPFHFCHREAMMWEVWTLLSGSGRPSRFVIPFYHLMNSVLLTSGQVNKAYAVGEPRITKFSASQPSTQRTSHTHSWLDPTLGELPRLNHEDLENALVLGQVDTKFIAFLARDNILVLVDQHAADERVRVEKFLRELCEGFLNKDAKTAVLAPPKKVLLTAAEAKTLRDGVVKEILGQWGVGVGEVGEGQGEYVQVEVEKVPLVVEDKVGFYLPHFAGLPSILN